MPILGTGMVSTLPELEDWGWDRVVPRRIILLSEDLGMDAEQKKTEFHHNLEKPFQIKIPCLSFLKFLI